jgi:predicted nuclease of predicted toxin-antitoxin system
LKIEDFGVLADQNIREAVVAFLRGNGFDVVSARENDLPGASDESLYRMAIADQRVIITHDRDFGRLAVFAEEHPPGIVYLRPGHLDTAFTIQQVRQLLAASLDVVPPFMVVADQTSAELRIRVRSFGGW